MIVETRGFGAIQYHIVELEDAYLVCSEASNLCVLLFLVPFTDWPKDLSLEDARTLVDFIGVLHETGRIG